MREVRHPKEDDEARINEGVNLFFDMIKKNNQIESTLWVPILFSCLVNGCMSSGLNYEEFKSLMEKMLIHYESWFNE